MNGIDDHLRRRNGSRIEGRTAPGNLDRQSREIDDRSVPAVATQVERGSHKDTVDWARFDTQRTKHALGVIDGEAADAETLAAADPFLADVDAVNGARLRALVASDAGGEVEAMETTVSGRHRCGQFWILKVFSECSAFLVKSTAENLEGHQHSLHHGSDGGVQIPKPFSHDAFTQACIRLANMPQMA